MQRTSSSTNPRLKQQASLLIIDLGLLIIDFSLPLPCQDFYTILLSPCELDFTMKTILQSPIWAQRVIYIRGECISLVGISLVGHLLGIVRPSRFNIWTSNWEPQTEGHNLKRWKNSYSSLRWDSSHFSFWGYWRLSIIGVWTSGSELLITWSGFITWTKFSLPARRSKFITHELPSPLIAGFQWIRSRPELIANIRSISPQAPFWRMRTWGGQGECLLKSPSFRNFPKV